MNEKLEDLFYAPIGLVSDASKVVPDLADRGRVQVANARLMGQMATKMGKDRAALGVGRVTDAIHSLLVDAGLAPREVEDPPAEPARADTVAAVEANDGDSPVAVAVVVDVDAPDSDTLAIVEYDSLAASQVVPRLAALNPDELEDVRRYELAHRGRKTILGRVAQLQG